VKFLFKYHTEMFKSIAEGRKEQVRKSAVSRRVPGKLLKKKKEKGNLKYQEVI